MISFLKKLTNKILKCTPDAWTTRWPWVIFFGVLFHIVLGAIVLVAEWDVRYDTRYEYWVSFISIFMVLALVFYLIYLLRFNVFKRFGKLSTWHYLGTFLTYFGIMALIVSWGYNPTAVTAATARLQYEEKDIARDINRMNVLINTLEYDSIPHLWTRRKVVLDTVVRNQTYYNDNHYDNSYEYAEAAVEAADAVNSEYTGYLFKTDSFYADRRVSYKDSSQFFAMLATDSVRRIDDTSYYRFYSPDYTYITNYHSFFNKRTEVELDKVALFHKTVENKPVIENKEALQQELYGLIKKYWAEGYDVYGYPHEYHEPGKYEFNKKVLCPDDFRLYINKKYSLDDLDEGIKNISNRYYMWEWQYAERLIYPMFYISLALSLMLFLFRHNRKKSFFYSILAGVLLFILSVTFLAITRSESQAILILMLVYYFIFGIITFGIFGSKRKSLVQDIAKNFFIYFFPILPMVITALYYDIKKDIFRSNHFTSSPDYSQLYSEAFKFESFAMIGSQVVGFILFLLMLHFVFSRILRKSYALPES